MEGVWGKATCWCWVFLLHPHPDVFLSFIPFVLSPEKLLLMARTPGFFGFCLGPTTERQHQGIRAWRRENVVWIFTSPCILAAFGHGAASCPQRLSSLQPANFFPSSLSLPLNLGAITASPARRGPHLVLISFNLFSPLSGISP